MIFYLFKFFINIKLVVSPAEILMESLITEPGPKNPLLFLSLSLVNRIPGYTPDEKETLNQLECLNDLISSVSVSIFRLESVKNPVAVAVDSLMSVAAVEAKKSILIRVSALECLKLLIEKLVSCGINSLIEMIPGILSKMIKICTGRIDVEVDKIIQLSLEIIELILKFFIEEQDDWINTGISDEKFVILKQKYRENIDMIVCSLRPIVKNRERSKMFQKTLLNIFELNLNNNFSSISSLKLYLILTSHKGEIDNTHITHKLNNTDKTYNMHYADNTNNKNNTYKRFIDIYNIEIVEWFEVNSESLNEIHEEILIEKLEIIFGLINLKNFESFLIISDLFKIIKRLTELKLTVSTVSIEYSDDNFIGIENSFSGLKLVENKIPKIKFKSKLKISKEFDEKIEKLFEKLIEIDEKTIEKLLIDFEDDSIEFIIQKLDLTSLYYRLTILRVRESLLQSSLDLFKDCLKYHERSIKTTSESNVSNMSQIIHLATLKLLWSASKSFPQIIKPNLLIILSAMTSEWIILKEISTQILKTISNPNEFIKENEMFLLDRLGIQLTLPKFYPETPQIISVLVREILNPSSAMKFTDLLVKRVTNNLALYQGYPAYCKDLLTVAKETIDVISKGEAVQFIDPKNFAFTTNSADDDDTADTVSADTSGASASLPLNCQQRIIIDLLKIGINFILSDSKLIRSKSIDLITCSVINFTKYNNNNSEPTELCQLIHLAWPNMMAVLKDTKNYVQLDVLVVESFNSCCSILFKKFPLFMRDRFVKDFWRLTIIKNMKLLSSDFKNSCDMKIFKLLLDTLNCGILNCKPSTEICLEILNYLKSSDDEKADYIFKSISVIEPDLIWYFYSIELGGINEIISPFPELKSFKILKNSNINNSLKSKLKQFII